MKAIATPFRHVIALAFVLLGATCITSVADDVLPRIAMDNVPLSDVIRTLARQANLNFILDPGVPGAGTSATQPNVTIIGTNTTEKAALSAVLKDHKLKMVNSPATTVTRIVPADANVEPVSAESVGTEKSDILPLMVLEDVP